MTSTQAKPAQSLAKQYNKGLLYGALVLAAISGILEIYSGVITIGLLLGLPLVLIGLVYFGGIALVAANYKRGLMIKIGIGWTLLIIVLWAASAAVNAAGTRETVSYVVKGIEVVLLILLVELWMGSGKKPAVAS
jgi:hypothetical protein